MDEDRARAIRQILDLAVEGAVDFQHAFGETAPDVPTTGPKPDWLMASGMMTRASLDLRAVVGDERLANALASAARVRSLAKGTPAEQLAAQTVESLVDYASELPRPGPRAF